MIDIHSHILPGVDDGSANWHVTLEMCRLYLADGCRHVIATSHCNFYYPYSRERHFTLVEELQKKVPEIQFSIGCELQLTTDNIQLAVNNPRRYVLNNSDYILVEFSEVTPALRMLDQVLPLLHVGLVPIIAHPERNAVLLKRPEIVRRLVAAGCLMQMTANSLTGYWGSAPMRMGLQLLKEGLVHFLATDAHDAKGRAPLLSSALKAAARVVGKKGATKLVLDNAKALLD